MFYINITYWTESHFPMGHDEAARLTFFFIKQPHSVHLNSSVRFGHCSQIEYLSEATSELTKTGRPFPACFAVFVISSANVFNIVKLEGKFFVLFVIVKE